MNSSLLEAFEAERRPLFAIAYRILGSASEAEDILQDAYEKLQSVSVAEVDNPAAYLTRVVTRLCIDEKRSARSRREVYLGPWLPEPLLTTSESDPLERAELVSQAFLFLIQQLTPEMRAAFLLKELFDYRYEEIGQVLEKSDAACRKLVQRAKETLVDRRPSTMVNKQAHQTLLQRLIVGLNEENVSAVECLLREDVVSRADGAGIKGVARKPILGAHAVARYLCKIAEEAPEGVRLEVREVNAWPALLIFVSHELTSVLQLETDDSLIRQIFITVSPLKLQALRAQLKRLH